jgi:PPOX class probable F420-dependent enzyme
MPICFVFDGHRLYTPIDRKPKRVSPLELRRVRNLRANPSVAVLFDHYADDWTKLAYVTVRGKARLLQRGRPYRRALELLTRKYPQYAKMHLASLGLPVIVIQPERVATWGHL